MDPDSDRVAAIVRRALAIAAEKRVAFLEEACAGDSALLVETRVGLAAAEATTSLIPEGCSPIATRPRETHSLFAVGNVISDRYRVIRFIAKGGMGEVYEVEDLELRSRIALKTLALPTAMSSQGLSSSKREIQLARRVTHPNVCRVYDLGHHRIATQGDIYFLSMELLHGNTLAEQIRQCGPMNRDEAQPLIQQMVSALAAAHSLGIVHRDFKPGNVMLTEEGGRKLVKVTDFGLSRSLDPDDNSTATKPEVVGTPAYMAPEQFHGEYGPHSDIYALGLVMFEMLTAKLPVSRDDPFQNLTPDALARIGPCWQGVIAKCVAREPANRFAQVEQVWPALMSMSMRQSGSIAGAVRRHALAVSVALVILLAGFGVVRSGLIADPFHRLPAQKHIAVLQFRSIGAGADQAFSDGVSETLTSKLSQLERYQKAFWVVPSADAREVKSPDDAYRKLNITLAVTGTIQNTSEGSIVTANLVDAGNHHQLASRTIHATASDREGLQDRVWEAVADMVDLQVTPEARQEIAAGGTKQPGAYELYEQGVGYAQHFDADNLNRAIDLFTKALSKDPNYALAYAGLGSAFVSKYDLTKDPQWIAKGKENATRALELNDRLAPVHIAMGKLYQDTGERDKARKEFRRVLDEDPANVQAAIHIGSLYEAEGKVSEAEAVYKALIGRRPGDPLGYDALGSLYYHTGQFAKAVPLLQSTIDLAPDNFVGYRDLGGTYVAQGRFNEAITVLTKGLALKENSESCSNLGTAYMFLERYQDAVEPMRRAAELSPHNDVLWRNLGDSYRQVPGLESNAAAAYRKALDAAVDRLKVNPNNAEALSGAALYHAHLGDKKEAEAFIAKALNLAPANSDSLFTSALAHEIMGRRKIALDEIDKAVQAGISIDDVEHEPELRELRSDPGYRQWLEQRRAKSKN